jgi:putative protease
MPTKKKAKSKTKRRSKPIAKKPVAKKPVGKKAVAKKPVAKKAVEKKPVAKKPVEKKPRQVMPPAPPPPPGERIGVVTHYYGHLSVAVVKLEPGTTLRVGDNIHVKGHTTDFSQPVESLQVAHAPVNEVGPNDDFGLKVKDHVREHDVVYRVK